MRLFEKKSAAHSSGSTTRKSESEKPVYQRYMQEAMAAGKAGDHEQELALYEQAAKLGHAQAQFQCGRMYSKGIGTAADEAKSLFWYEKAANQGFVDAQFQCGEIYYHRRRTFETNFPVHHGKSVEEKPLSILPLRPDRKTMENLSKALFWYEKAAKQGHIDAQFQCGVMYDKGEGTPEDKAKALIWYEKIARQGHARAQFRCGEMYYLGLGTAVDRIKSKEWFEKAAEQNHNDTQPFT